MQYRIQAAISMTEHSLSIVIPNTHYGTTHSHFSLSLNLIQTNLIERIKFAFRVSYEMN